MTLLEVRNLSKSYKGRRTRPFTARPRVTAVDDVSFSLQDGETLALVGESGVGKSTVGRLITRLVEPDAGQVMFDGVDLLTLRRRDMREQRRHLQMIFQDPYGSLDPRIPIGDSVGEPLLVHDGTPTKERRTIAAEWLERVGLGSHYMRRFPRELSGGQLQRACIARALVLQPRIVVCDEPTAALDVSVQAQVLNLMLDLQRQLGLSYLFISHDLALVHVIADRVAVMAEHQIVETGVCDEVLTHPKTDYARSLLAAVPVPVPRGQSDRDPSG
jgi:oligopeptide transport system ATP-binding protein